MNKDFVMLIPFIDQSHSFVHGFECGTIWQMLVDRKEIKDKTIHTASIEQFEMMCEALKYKSVITTIDLTWSTLTATPLEKLKDDYILKA